MERIDQERSPRGLPARKAGGPGGGRSSLGRLPPPREAWRKRTGESRRQGEAPLAWRRRGRPPARRQAPISLLIYRKLNRPRLWAGAKRRGCGAGRSASPMPPKRPKPPPSARAPPRWSCRHPVCGRVSRTRGAGGAYNTELAAAKGRGPEGGAPRGPRDGRKKLSEKSS